MYSNIEIKQRSNSLSIHDISYSIKSLNNGLTSLHDVQRQTRHQSISINPKNPIEDNDENTKFRKCKVHIRFSELVCWTNKHDLAHSAWRDTVIKKVLALLRCRHQGQCRRNKVVLEDQALLASIYCTYTNIVDRYNIEWSNLTRLIHRLRQPGVTQYDL